MALQNERTRIPVVAESVVLETLDDHLILKHESTQIVLYLNVCVDAGDQSFRITCCHPKLAHWSIESGCSAAFGRTDQQDRIADIGRIRHSGNRTVNNVWAAYDQIDSAGQFCDLIVIW